jgi:5-methylcytosine-specific restriction enzyme subunit McrC
MEYIFEDFVFGFLSEKWLSVSFNSQSTCYLALNHGDQVFQIRNDIYIEDKLIIDTKYKIRDKKDELKEGVSQSDLYQMISYALRRNCTDVLLLYPFMKTAMNTPGQFKIPSQMLVKQLNVLVKSLDITFDDIHEADQIIIDRMKELEIEVLNLSGD